MPQRLPETPGQNQNRRAPRLRVGFAIALLVFCLLQLNGRSIISTDSLPYRYLPDALIGGHTFRLDAFPQLAAPGNYSIVPDREGHLISKKPALPGLALVPLHMLYRAALGQAPQKETHRMLLGKLAASAEAGLAAAVMFFLAGAAGARRRWLAPAAALGMVFLTPFWFTAMDCWPHPLLALLHGAALWALLARRERGWAWGLIGLLEGLAIAARLGAVSVTLVFILAALARRNCGLRIADCGLKKMRNAECGMRNDETGVQNEESALRAPHSALEQSAIRNPQSAIGWMLAGLLGPLALLGWYNAHYFGSPFSQGFGAQAAGRLQEPLSGAAGLLFSPAKGLFLFSPVLLTACAALGRAGWRRFEVRFCAWAIAVQILFWACYADWMGGWCYGPRYLADVAPLFTLLAVAGLENLLDWADGTARAGWVRAAVALLAALSLLIQLAGMFGWDAEYDRVFDRGFGKRQEGWVWQAPPEPWWILRRGVWYWPRHIP